MSASPLTTVVALFEGGVNWVARLVQSEGDLVGTLDFPRVPQLDSWSCGLRCVEAVCLHHHIDLSDDEIMEGLGTTEEGTAATPIVRFLR